MKKSLPRTAAATLIGAVGFVTLVATGGPTPPPNTCTLKGGVSVTSAGNGSRDRLGVAFVCAGEQVKLVWSHSNAVSAELRIGAEPPEEVELQGERIITVQKDLEVSMTSVGQGAGCTQTTRATVDAMQEGDLLPLTLTPPGANSTAPYLWTGRILGSAITSGLKVKSIRLISDCGVQQWRLRKIDPDGVQHPVQTLISGQAVNVDLPPGGEYQAEPVVTEFLPTTCSISMHLILGCN